MSGTQEALFADFVSVFYASEGHRVCAACRFARWSQEANAHDGRAWECRKKAPRLDPQPLNHFPRMLGSDTCGMWEADEAVAAVGLQMRIEMAQGAE